MARKLRIDFPGCWHHVYHRGARKAPIFLDEEHCLLFFEQLEETTEEYGLEVHGFALMPNHYHLLVRTPLGNLSRCMRHLNATYTQRLNRMHDWDGPLFRGRFRSEPLMTEDYLLTVLAYLHLNPVRAKLVRRPDEDRSWTSHRMYLGLARPLGWLRTETMLKMFGGGEGLKNYVLSLHKGATQWPEDFELSWGRFLVDPTIYAEEAARRQKATIRDPDEVLRHVVAITNVELEEIKRASRGPGANPARRFAVRALASATQLTQREIGELLEMPTSQVSNVLRRLRIAVPPVIREWLGALRNNVES